MFVYKKIRERPEGISNINIQALYARSAIWLLIDQRSSALTMMVFFVSWKSPSCALFELQQ